MEIVDGRRPKGLSPNHTQMIATLETQIERCNAFWSVTRSARWSKDGRVGNCVGYFGETCPLDLRLYQTGGA